ncbi:MAG: EI24 domain-containing protein [Acidobacteria bacterium]|nr:EI24 domain-containing protein [Acidobacteriota bacterium]
MLRALALALPTLADRRLLPIWLKSLMVALAAFLVLGALGWWLIVAALHRFAADDGLSELFAALIVLVAGWLAWRIIALAVLQFFADDVVLAVEQRSYPAIAAKARKLGLAEEARRALAGAGRALLYNGLALPVAAVLAITGIGAPLVFLLVNAVLLGRELQDMVWLRHRPSPESPAPLTALERFGLGGTVTLLLTVPVVNFIAPFLGAACAVHLIHRKGAPSS